ncbi:MAG: hypothetical protein MJK12_07000 [Colwellia sp.]|nr:hypothetical protein [Colwellia sp.]
MKEASNEWQQLQAQWQTQADSLSADQFEQRLNKYINLIRKKNLIEIIELIFDLFVGGLIIWFALNSMLNDFSVMKGIKSPSQFMQMITALTLLYGGLIAIGVVIPFLSIRFRRQLWNKNSIADQSSKLWITNYFDGKIKQCLIGRVIGVLIAITFWFPILFLCISQGYVNGWDSPYDISFRFTTFVLFPLSIYLVALWQKKKFVKLKEQVLSEFNNG